ncbi:transcription factor bHLH162-like isoform X2 [Diospyros lotus]|uniref:transcription factor bHLH162-like isoform X2 n=1 Tax=Diospyros lotus TaxID=55363 RepID=UPI002251004C|nr:transcription factor bHLH162-like isoform X2 [Diospyros lotus]
MAHNSGSGSSRADRKTIEKNRRNHMKDLYSKLNSLVPHHTSEEGTSLVEQLDEAANYIKRLQQHLDEMKQKKERLMMRVEQKSDVNGSIITSTSSSSSATVGLRSPQVEIHDLGSALEIVLVTGLDCQAVFNETIRVLHEEGAEINNASFSVVDDFTVFHTIHSKVGESAVGFGAARIAERLRELCQG